MKTDQEILARIEEVRSFDWVGGHAQVLIEYLSADEGPKTNATEL